MFIEPGFLGERRGWVEVICGSMFSGKTEELIRRLKRAKFASLKTEIFKPAMDIRFDEIKIISHDENAIQSTPVDAAQTILLMAQDVDVIGIDEAQFFDPDLPNVCDALANRGIRVVVAGLDMDFMGNPFGQMPAILARSEFVTKLHAICMKCGNIANYSYRKVANGEQVMLGANEVYEPRCRKCYNEGH